MDDHTDQYQDKDYYLDRATGLKRCQRCKTLQIMAAFTPTKLTPDGLSVTCLQCQKAFQEAQRREPKPSRRRRPGHM